MKNVFKLLILVTMLCMLLCGCSSNGEQNAGGEPVDLSKYKIVYALGTSESVKTEIKTMVSEIKDSCGVELKKMSSDFLYDDTITSYESPDAEILIGNTNRAESIKARDKVDSEMGYVVWQTGNKIVLYGEKDEAIICAIKQFAKKASSGGSFSIPSEYLYVGDCFDDTYPEGSAMRTVLDEYTVVYAAENDVCNEYQTAYDLTECLNEYSDTRIKPHKDTNVFSKNSKEILIGQTNRQESISAMEGLGMYDSKITVKGDKIVIVGGCTSVLNRTAQSFFEMLKNNTVTLSDGWEINNKIDIKLSPIAQDFSSFTPNWINEYTPAAWLSNVGGSNFAEKTCAVVSPTSEGYRITSKAHRGDMKHYPECSLEGLASCIWAGIDAIELDVHMTKDGVPILMHDSGLGRMTNASDFAGKEGYPNDTKVSAWTYEQISALNLKSGYGGDGAELTEYKVATLYEALMIASDRIFIHIDDKDGELVKSGYVSTDVYRLAAATDSKECFFYYHGLGLMETWLKYDKSDADFSAYVDTCEEYLDRDGYSIRKTYWPNEQYNAWGSSASLKENEDKWKQMVEKDYYTIWTEDPLAISGYISRKYSPTLQ